MLRILSLICVLAAAPAAALDRWSFDSIDGGPLEISGTGPVLIVNTASRCGFTKQYDGLQALYDRFANEGLTVLAVPSNDFRQELGSEEQVKSFCEVNFGLTLPMTTITPVTGPDAHPFYTWLRDTHGIEPNWNFNKVLIGTDGQFVAYWGSSTRPMSRPIVEAIEQELTRTR